MPEKEQRIYIKRGELVRLVLEGGLILEISHHPSAAIPFKLEQKSLDLREAQREQLRATYPSTLLPHIKARLDQYGYQVLGRGEEIGADLMAIDTQQKLRIWVEKAKTAGISNGEITEATNEILRQIVIGSSREGRANPLVKSIGTEVSNIVDEVWGVKKKKNSK